jgi:hypothetical protein
LLEPWSRTLLLLLGVGLVLRAVLLLLLPGSSLLAVHASGSCCLARQHAMHGVPLITLAQLLLTLLLLLLV